VHPPGPPRAEPRDPTGAHHVRRAPDAGTVAPVSLRAGTPGPRPPGAKSIDQLLEEARSRITRVTPAEAARRVADGALLVDIRPQSQREADGEVPGALVVERNHLEWRLDPGSDARLPQATGYDIDVVVLCQEGYSSSLAADALRSLGLVRASDVVGGHRAWVADGLPTTRGPAAQAGPRGWTRHAPAGQAVRASVRTSTRPSALDARG
jgi:rhodanese-related sulfurtransferase